MAQYYMFICPNCGTKIAATKEEADQKLYANNRVELYRYKCIKCRMPMLIKGSAMTEIETTSFQIGDRLRVGRYTATCQKVTEKGATFLLDQYLDRPMPMNKKNTNHGGYDNSDLRKALQSDEVLNIFADIRDCMVPFENGDLLRIPFAGEMFGDNLPSWVKPDGHEQWPLMKDAHNRVASRCGEPEWGWLANTVRDTSTNFCFVDDYVDDYGFAYGWYAPGVLGVRPAFLIA